ncbi:MAG: YciI family protein [Cyclobacteriaceae bacterium]
MKEFMLLIRTEGDHLQSLSPQAQQEHIQKVMVYIEYLMKDGKLKSAQPLEQEGLIISGTKGKLKDGPFNESKEVIAGYFLIQARDLNEAIQIAKNNPVFESASTARIEVRPIKILEGING